MYRLVPLALFTGFPSIVRAQCPPAGPVSSLFGPQQIISTQALTPYSAFATDLDGDGDPDVLAAAKSIDEIAGFENLGGGVFGPQLVISSLPDGPEAVYATDLDGDGDPDVLSASHVDNTIAWFPNLGNGAFGNRIVVCNTAADPTDVFAADLDGDGDADVLWPEQNGDNQISKSRNNGGGVFAAVEVVTGEVSGAEAVFAADLDGDGDNDVLSASKDDDKVAWYENLGGWSFGAQQVISLEADSPRSIYVTDLDGDGDNDVLSGSYLDDKVAWYENLAFGIFGPQRVISTAGDGIQSVYATDLDGDGDADVLSAGDYSNSIAWHENLGGGAFGPEQQIWDLATCAEYVYAADLDGDGDSDVLSASRCDNEVAWYENLSEERLVDADGDGLADHDEVWAQCTDPLVADTDGGGESDGAEVASGTDPLDAADDGVVVDGDGDGFANALDCDDTNPAISPGAAEVCDAAEVDENCDGFADDDDLFATGELAYYADLDGDGFGGTTVWFCDVPEGFFPLQEDCDDTDAAIHPSAEEVCDFAVDDEDCNGLFDDDDSAATGKTTAYFDADADGFGGLTSALYCTIPAGWFANSVDCDDGDSDIHPGAEETDCLDTTDYNCDGSSGLSDVDLDGFPACEDCNDGGSAWYPGAPESDCGSFQDLNCDGSVGHADADLDGFPACAECDDGDAAAFPGAPELVGDGIDGDCNGVEVCYVDADGDGFRPDDRAIASADGACDGTGQASSLAPTDDCNDLDVAVYPGAPESDCTDPVDYNCDGSTNYADADADGFAACLDCNDGNSAINPHAAEVCNGGDDDCDGSSDEDSLDPGTWYADADGDGFTDPQDRVVACEAPEGYAAAAEDDCADDDAGAFPGAVEVAGDGVDQDCNGTDQRVDAEEKGCATAPGSGGWLLFVLGFGSIGMRNRLRSNGEDVGSTGFAS